MAQVRFDIAERLDLYFRIARSGSKTFTFVDASGDPFDVSGFTWEFRIRPFGSTTNIVEITPTVDANTIDVAVTDEDSTIPEKLYFWELYESSEKKTWLCGNAHFTSKDPADASDSAT